MHSFAKCLRTVQYLHRLEHRRAAWALSSAERSEPTTESEVQGVVAAVGASPLDPGSGVLYLSGVVQLLYTVGRGHVMSVP